MKEKERRARGRSVQELMGIQGFSKYGLTTDRGELAFFSVAPTNISVLSHASIEGKIRNLMAVLSAVPEMEVLCTDSSECFDENMANLKERLRQEPNAAVRELIRKDVAYLDREQVEMASARQFFFLLRLKEQKEKQTFETLNRVEKTLNNRGFEVRRMKKEDIKRLLALYFEASRSGDQMPDGDGEQYMEEVMADA